MFLISKRRIAAIKDAIAGAITSNGSRTRAKKNWEEVFALLEVFTLLEWHNQQTTTEILIRYITFTLLDDYVSLSALKLIIKGQESKGQGPRARVQ